MEQREAWVERLIVVTRQLHDEPEPQAAMEAAAHFARDHVEGCDSASIALVRRNGRIQTLGATDPTGSIGDMLQFALGEGPCLDAAWDQVVVRSADLLRDERWPAWGIRMSRDYGAGSALSLPMFTHADHVGVLTLYSRDPHGMDAYAREAATAGSRQG
jgi:GAF domain-containing protein